MSAPHPHGPWACRLAPDSPSGGGGGGDAGWGRPAPGSLSGRTVIVGVTGGIAAYKTATLVSRLAQGGAAVTVAMTESAQRFVTPLTFQALSGRAVYSDIWSQADLADPQHIRLARSAHLAIVAPASMDFLARLACGMADDPVSLILSAVDRRTCPVLLAPSMNEVMWSQPATARNLATLRGDGFEVIDPAHGWQACRTSGPGRMPEPEDLADEVARRLARG